MNIDLIAYERSVVTCEMDFKILVFINILKEKLKWNRFLYDTFHGIFKKCMHEVKNKDIVEIH